MRRENAEGKRGIHEKGGRADKDDRKVEGEGACRGEEGEGHDGRRGGGMHGGGVEGEG